MTEKIHVEFDSIIFGLQSYGGISNYWNRLLQYAATDSDLVARLILPNKIKYKDFDSQTCGHFTVMREKLDPRLSRYLHAPSSSGVLHTSYYRLPGRRAGRYVVSVYDFTYERYRS